VEILYLLIPLAVLVAAVVVWAFLWSIRSGQFDDLEGPAHRIILDKEPTAHTDTHDPPHQKTETKR